MSKHILNEIFDAYFDDGHPKDLTSLQASNLADKYMNKSITICGYIVDVRTSSVTLENNVKYSNHRGWNKEFKLRLDVSVVNKTIDLKNYNKYDWLEVSGYIGKSKELYNSGYAYVFLPIKITPLLNLVDIDIRADILKKLESNWLDNNFFGLKPQIILKEEVDVEYEREIDYDIGHHLWALAILSCIFYLIYSLFW